jgi:hypothetical protein
MMKQEDPATVGKLGELEVGPRPVRRGLSRDLERERFPALGPLPVSPPAYGVLGRTGSSSQLCLSTSSTPCSSVFRGVMSPPPEFAQLVEVLDKADSLCAYLEDGLEKYDFSQNDEADSAAGGGSSSHESVLNESSRSSNSSSLDPVLQVSRRCKAEHVPRPITFLHLIHGFFWSLLFPQECVRTDLTRDISHMMLILQLVAYTRFMASSLREGRGKTTAEVLASITEKYNRLVQLCDSVKVQHNRPLQVFCA